MEPAAKIDVSNSGMLRTTDFSNSAIDGAADAMAGFVRIICGGVVGAHPSDSSLLIACAGCLAIEDRPSGFGVECKRRINAVEMPG